MRDKICHLCLTHYMDDIFFKEHPGHTPQQCLEILQFRCRELGGRLSEAQQNLKRAKREYHLGGIQWQ